ncbi:hypothetical protein [Streptomyces sp. NPDC054995]
MNRSASPRPYPPSPGLPSLQGVIFASVVGSVLVLAAAGCAAARTVTALLLRRLARRRTT